MGGQRRSDTNATDGWLSVSVLSGRRLADLPVALVVAGGGPGWHLRQLGIPPSWQRARRAPGALCAERHHRFRELRAANVTIDKIDNIMRRSLEFLANCYTTYVSATPQLRRQLNQAVFEAFMVTNQGVFIARPTEPFRTLLRTDALQAKGVRTKKAVSNMVHDSMEWVNGRPRWLVEAETRRTKPGRPTPVLSGLGLNKDYLAEGVGFEPTGLVGQGLSRGA